MGRRGAHCSNRARARAIAFRDPVPGGGRRGLWAALGFRDPFFAMLAAVAIFIARYRRVVARVVEAVEQPAHDLALLAQVLAPAGAGALHSRRGWWSCAPRWTWRASRPPSASRSLNRLIEMLDSRDNPFMRSRGAAACCGPSNWPSPSNRGAECRDPRCGAGWTRWARSKRCARWRPMRGSIPRTCFRSSNPATACFDGEELAHPLLDQSRVVRNSVRLGGDLRVLIVSGSNMSGKSTLLRTVGINAVLAQAGAPVRARRLRLSPLALGASIRALDSLQDGTSRFYAEITRLHQIMELTAGALPVLFLLDELLHGTNSHDRRIGAEAIVRGLVERGAIGLVTTHDLALAHIAEALAPRAANVHFEDQFGERAHDLRLPAARGSGGEEQCARVDAVGGVGGVRIDDDKLRA